MTHRFDLHQKAKLALAAGLVILAPGLAVAQETGCPALKGAYAFSFSGTAVSPGSPTAPAPFNGIGFQTFDGNGRWTSVASANFNGFILRSYLGSGTYTVKPDCTGSMTAVFPDGSSGTQDFVVTKGGKSLYAIGVDAAGPGSMLTTTFTRMK